MTQECFCDLDTVLTVDIWVYYHRDSMSFVLAEQETCLYSFLSILEKKSVIQKLGGDPAVLVIYEYFSKYIQLPLSRL